MFGTLKKWVKKAVKKQVKKAEKTGVIAAKATKKCFYEAQKKWGVQRLK